MRTNRASLSDMFGPEVLINTQTGEAATDELLEEIIDCDFQFGDNLSARKGIQTSARQERPEAPESYFDECADAREAMWRKDLTGCPFSEECDDNPERNCYFCTQDSGTSCNNGCGAADNPIRLSRVPLTFDFTNSCCGHDYCYASQAFSQSACDNAMFWSTVRSCFQPEFRHPMSLGNCLGFATRFRGILHMFGSIAFDKARIKQEAHLETCKESPTPLPTPEVENFTAIVITDPHLRTFDGLRFDCQASGEFILARSFDAGLMIQGRFHGESTSGSVFKAIAIKEGGSPTVQISVQAEDGPSNCQLLLTVDGARRSFVSASFGGDEFISVEVGPGSAPVVQVFTALGCIAEFVPRLSRNFGCYLESFSLSIPASLAPGITGLLGTPNNDTADDWQSAEGRVLSAPDTISDRLFKSAYNYCTGNWCVKGPEKNEGLLQ